MEVQAGNTLAIGQGLSRRDRTAYCAAHLVKIFRRRNSLIDPGFRARMGVQSLPLELLPKMQAVDQGEK